MPRPVSLDESKHGNPLLSWRSAEAKTFCYSCDPMAATPDWPSCLGGDVAAHLGGDPGRARHGAVGEPTVRGYALALWLRLVLLPPGVEGAHEKGGVKGEIDRFRRRHLTPVPHVGSLRALNTALAATAYRDDARRTGARAETVGAAAVRELPLLALVTVLASRSRTPNPYAAACAGGHGDGEGSLPAVQP